MNLFGKPKSIDERNSAEDAEQMDRLQKLVSRAWETELKPDTDLRYKSQ